MVVTAFGGSGMTDHRATTRSPLAPRSNPSACAQLTTPTKPRSLPRSPFASPSMQLLLSGAHCPSSPLRRQNRAAVARYGTPTKQQRSAAPARQERVLLSDDIDLTALRGIVAESGAALTVVREANDACWAELAGDAAGVGQAARLLAQMAAAPGIGPAPAALAEAEASDEAAEDAPRATERRLSSHSVAIAGFAVRKFCDDEGAVVAMLDELSGAVEDGQVAPELKSQLKAMVLQGSSGEARELLADVLRVMPAAHQATDSERLALALAAEEKEQELSFLRAQEADARFMAEIHLQPGFASCPSCSVVIETVSGDAAPESPAEQVPNGATLELEAAASHRASHRFRCRSCDTVFCKECNASPYHFGFDCESWKMSEESINCRFCNDVLQEEAPAVAAPAPAQESAAVSDGDGGAEMPAPQPRLRMRIACCKDECRELDERACARALPCGHACFGVHDESVCPPCFKPECESREGVKPEPPASDEWCAICYTAELSGAPCMVLGCGHGFHANCLTDRIDAGRAGAKLAFNFLDCPSCNQRMEHPALAAVLAPHVEQETVMRKKASARWLRENAPPPAVSQRRKRWKVFARKAMEEEAAQRLVELEKAAQEQGPRSYFYYPCHKCGDVYFGGAAQCGDGEAHAVEPSELECHVCSSVGVETCELHGPDYLIFKCRWCCQRAPATFFCGGTTHFCNDCHQLGWSAKAKPCVESDCWFNGEHPENAVSGLHEYALGCSVCRNEAEI